MISDTEVCDIPGSPVTSGKEGVFSDLDTIDSSFVSDGSIYIPTPQKKLWEHRVSLEVPIPNSVCFLEVKQLEAFIQRVNSCRRCVTPGCSGILVPSSVKKSGLGGAISVTFSCSGCLLHHIPFESSVKSQSFSTTKVGAAVQVAFIVAGCTHATYSRALKHALGIDAIGADTFMSTIIKLYPVVKQMVDEI